jgi:hypothetical protein
MFPGAARANPTIFYDGRRARSVAEVYQVLVGRYDVARGSPPSTPTMVANAESVPATGKPQPAARNVFAPDTAQVAQAYAAAMTPPPVARDSGPVFHGLFRTGATREAVAPLVSALWTAPQPLSEESAAAPAKTAAKAGPTPRPKPMPLPDNAKAEVSLFQDLPADARALFRGRV